MLIAKRRHLDRQSQFLLDDFAIIRKSLDVNMGRMLNTVVPLIVRLMEQRGDGPRMGREQQPVGAEELRCRRERGPFGFVASRISAQALTHEFPRDVRMGLIPTPVASRSELCALLGSRDVLQGLVQVDALDAVADIAPIEDVGDIGYR